MRLGVLSLISLSALLDAPASAQQVDIQAFRDGRTNRFTSKGHSKAVGLNITFDIPVEWTPQENNDPHMLVKYWNPDKSAYCAFTVIDLGKTISHKEAVEVFEPKSLKKMMPEGYSVLDARSITLDGLPAGMTISRTIAKIPSTKIELETVTFSTAYSSNFIQLVCGLSSVNAQASSSPRFVAYRPVFTMIANSIVVHDQRDRAK